MSSSPSSVPDRPSPLTRQALQLRHANRYAAHPVEVTVRHFRELLGSPGEESHRGLDFQSAEGIYRAGAQGIPLPQIPQLPQSVVELTRLRAIDQAARRHLRLWAEAQSTRQTGELAVIDPYISLARRGSWAALKLAEVGIACPADDPLPPAEEQPA